MSQAALIGRQVVSRYLFGAVNLGQWQVALFTVNKHRAFPVIHVHVSDLTFGCSLGPGNLIRSISLLPSIRLDDRLRARCPLCR
jgi:hypothetical protein